MTVCDDQPNCMAQLNILSGRHKKHYVETGHFPVLTRFCTQKTRKFFSGSRIWLKTRFLRPDLDSQPLTCPLPEQVR